MKRLLLLLWCISPLMLYGQSKKDLVIEDKTLLQSIQAVTDLFDLELTAGALSGKDKISKRFTSKTSDEMLSSILKGTTYDYTVREKRIIVHKKKTTDPPKASNIKHTISGYIYDKESGETLIGANIYSESDGTGASTNVYGFYSLTLPAGVKNIQVSYVGYQTVTETIELTADVEQNYNLGSSIELEDVVITAKQVERIENQARMSTVTLPIEDLKTLPVIGGEVDIIKALQLMPGVQGGSEGFAGLYVRGGSPDQNLIMLDGVPIYNASHLFGIFSVFNSDAIKSTELIKGGYPARYGGRLSSILDIRMKDGNMNKWTGQGSLGLISSKATIEGPIIKDKMSLMVSGRRTYLDLAAKPFIKRQRKKDNIKGTPDFYFYDLNAKLNYKVSNKDRIYLSLYNGTDLFSDNQESKDAPSTEFSYERKEKTSLDWGNTIAALRWNHLFSNKLFSNLTLTRTLYKFSIGGQNQYTFRNGNQEEKSSEFFKYQSDVKDYTLKLDFDYIMSPSNTLRFGTEVVKHRFAPGALTIKENAQNINQDTVIGGLPIDAYKYMAYVEDEISRGESIKINAGVNASMFSVNGKNYKNLEPRVLANVKLSEKWSTKASYTQMNQYLHLLTNSGIGLPTDLWLPPTDKIPQQRSWQAAWGLAHTTDSGIEVSLEGYYKDMKNLIAYKEGASFVLFSEGWEEQVTQGVGRSFGAEIFVKKNFGKTRGWVGYTLSKTDRQFDEINFGKRYPFKFDRTHDFSIVVNHQLSDRWTLGANWVYSTGSTTSIPLQVYDAGVQNYWRNESFHYGSKNSFRFKPYHRMDLSLSYKKEVSWGESSFHLDIYNVYNRLNTFYLDLSTQYDPILQKPVRKLKEVTLLPIIPTVRWDFKF